MLPFRFRFTLRRIFSPKYFRHLSQVLANPLSFYFILFVKLTPGLSKKPFQLRLKDGKIFLVPEFWTLFLFDEIFIEQCYEAPEVLSHAPYSLIVDIGANIGTFTLRAKQIWPDAHIISIEPHPENFAKLQRHVEINHLDNIQTLQMGVAEKCGCFDLYLSPRNIGGHSVYKKAADSVAISIKTLTLADVMKDSITTPHGALLKIDCEGCEYPLLSTLTPELASRISCIIFEPEHSLYDLNLLLTYLRTLGFQTSTHLNLIVASK